MASGDETAAPEDDSRWVESGVWGLRNVRTERTWQVVGDGEILADFTGIEPALRYIAGLNDDWKAIELVTVTWRYDRVER